MIQQGTGKGFWVLQQGTGKGFRVLQQGTGKGFQVLQQGTGKDFRVLQQETGKLLLAGPYAINCKNALDLPDVTMLIEYTQ